MTTAVELQRLGYFYGLCDVVLCHGFLGLFNELVEIVHISAVVFAVMEVKKMTANNGFKGVQIVG